MQAGPQETNKGSCFNVANNLMLLVAVALGVWQALLPPPLPPGACPTLLLDVSASGTKTSRKMAYLLLIAQGDKKSCWGRCVWSAALYGSRSQASSSAGKQIDLGAGC